MYPLGANGGSQSVVDARALAVALAGHPGDPAGGLSAYESQRIAATHEVVLANRAMLRSWVTSPRRGFGRRLSPTGGARGHDQSRTRREFNQPLRSSNQST